jgi:hypothetical protein
MISKRSLLLPLLTAFDFADTTQPCVQRNVTTVAPQALALLNNDFVHQQSEALASRVEKEAAADLPSRIERAWWLAMGRAPAPAELDAATAHVVAQAARIGKAESAEHQAFVSLCHVLLNTNEFIYVD